MKKLLCALVLATAFFCCGCNAEEMSGLKDISRPYAGEYQCKKLLLGGEDMLGKFDYLKLRLDHSGSYCLFYESEEGRGERSGSYELSPEEGKITLKAPLPDGEKKYVFSYRKGAILMELQFHEKLLYAEFSAAA